MVDVRWRQRVCLVGFFNLGDRAFLGLGQRVGLGGFPLFSSEAADAGDAGPGERFGGGVVNRDETVTESVVDNGAPRKGRREEAGILPVGNVPDAERIREDGTSAFISMWGQAVLDACSGDGKPAIVADGMSLQACDTFDVFQPGFPYKRKKVRF